MKKETQEKENRGSVEREQMLIDAVLLRQYDTVQALLEAGVFIDARDAEHEETALMFAASDKKPDLTRLLLEKGASVNLQDNRGCSALMIALLRGRIPNVRLLIENGADMKMRDTGGDTPLLYSVSLGDIEVVKALLNYLPDPFAEGEGEKALESASGCGYLGIIELLQKKRGKMECWPPTERRGPGSTGKSDLTLWRMIHENEDDPALDMLVDIRRHGDHSGFLLLVALVSLCFYCDLM